MKQEFRKQMIQSLKTVDPIQKGQWDEVLAQQFWQSTAYQKSQRIALFMSMDFEVNTSPLLARALEDQKEVVLPKVLGKGKMAFFPYQPGELTPSSFGVLEPNSDQACAKEEIDLILVPGLAWNSEGYRIGYGGGFYDRYLADYQGATISIVYPFQRQIFSPQAFDIPVQEVLTSE
ncbi:5-formyltetrahydrofolate cyclo-ligase [Streptococcus sp. DD13]|uniref:5-formyltetrahydrofolate cyclo-ligase n=1 Tax=Streptococcus sp. DD13 TaxID=1777881 RepID=UPI000797C366|nr:5-formyltetrahydrofolate cyclo-ligase [Streptococcus sp. DD13]KXT77670.1 5-formyltetrahydrofolate cyclo-ligase [Streptococcus sp. DD13]